LYSKNETNFSISWYFLAEVQISITSINNFSVSSDEFLYGEFSSKGRILIISIIDPFSYLIWHYCGIIKIFNILKIDYNLNLGKIRIK